MIIFVFALLVQDAPPKIGTVSLNACFETAPARELKQELKNRKDAAAKELKDLEDKIRHVEGIMRDLPPEGALYQKYRQERALLLATHKAKEELTKVELQEFWQKARAQIYERAVKAVREVARAKGLDLVLREDSILEELGGVLFRADRFDITPDVVGKMNADWKK
jgi:Skp family chaperone for outer membrane proteins